MHRDIHGMCNDYSCNLRTPEGYCRVTACIKSVPTVTSSDTSGDYIQVLGQTSVTDFDIKAYIKVYLKDHSWSDLMKVIADMI